MSAGAVSFQAAKCPECGADIQVPRDRDTIKCMYCGKDIVVRQAVQAVAGPTVENWMKLAEAAEESGNYEEAYDYFTRVLEVEPENCEAWLGKAVAAGWGSGLNANRFSELVSGIRRAVGCAPEDKREDIAARGAAAIVKITAAFYKLSQDHTKEFISLDGTWGEHVVRCGAIVDALIAGNELDPSNAALLKQGIEVTKSMIEGVGYFDEFDTYGDGDYKKYKTLELPAALEKRIRATMDGFVAMLQALEPSYEAPKVQKVGEWTLSGCLVVIALIAIVVMGLWWMGSWIFSKVTHSSSDTSVDVPVATSVATVAATGAVGSLVEPAEAPSTRRAQTNQNSPIPTTAPIQTETASERKAPPRPPKVVKIEFIDVEERPKSAVVHVGDTLEISVPERQGRGWKVVGEQPTSGAFIQGYLGPNTPGLKHIWKIAGAPGKRTIKFVEKDENDPGALPRETRLIVTVE